MPSDPPNDAGAPSLAIPAYDRALRAFMTLAMEGLVGADPLFGGMGNRSTGHAGPVRNVPGPRPVDHGRTSFRDVLAIDDDVVRTTDVEAFVAALSEVAARYQDKLGSTLLQAVGDITEATGNAIDAAGRPLTWDLVLEGLERIEVAFDEDGKPRPMQVLMNPETARLLLAQERTPEHDRRYEAIMRRKKEQWDAQKRARRLPRSGQGTGV